MSDDLKERLRANHLDECYEAIDRIAELEARDPMDDPRVKALVEAADDAATKIVVLGVTLRHEGAINDAQMKMFDDVFYCLRAALAAMKGGQA